MAIEGTMIHYAWIIALSGALLLLLTQGFGRMSYSVILPSMSLSDVLGRRHGSLLAYLTVALSFLLIALWRSTTGAYVSSIVFGLSMSSLPAIKAAAVGDSVGGRLAPAALGLITLIFGIGQSLGPAVAGWIKDATGTFAWAFILCTIVSLTGAAGSLLLRKKT